MTLQLSVLIGYQIVASLDHGGQAVPISNRMREQTFPAILSTQTTKVVMASVSKLRCSGFSM